MVVKEVTCDAVAQGEYQCLEAPTTSLGSSVTPSVTRSTSRLVRIPTTIIMGSPERLTNNTLTTTITTTAPTARESEEVKKATSCVAGPILRSSARVQKRHRDSSPSTSRQPSKKLGTGVYFFP